MFSKKICNLALTNEIADELFPNITGDNLGEDNTFLATLRAILGTRLKEDNFVRLKCRLTNHEKYSFDGLGDRELAALLSEEIMPNTIFICGFNGTEDGISASFEKIENSFIKINKGFKEVNDLRVFLGKYMNVRVYINEEIMSAAIFVGNLDIRTWHLLQSVIPRFVPWFFEDSPLGEEERNLLKSLKNRYASRYEALIETFTDKYDFRNKKIERLLNGFESSVRKSRLQIIEHAIVQKENEIDVNVNMYRDLIEVREDLLTQRAGLKQQIIEADNDSEIIDYFICNHHLDPIIVSGYSLGFIVSCYLENFDPDMYERISNNSNSYIYSGYGVTNETFISCEARKLFLDTIFSSEPLLKIKMCAYYVIDLRGEVITQSGYDFPIKYKDRMPNPHLQYYACLGNHKCLIEERLRNGDVVGAVEQCVSSAKSVNIGEDVTLCRFLSGIFSNHCEKIVELPDGTSCTPTEAYDWLNSQKNVQED